MFTMICFLCSKELVNDCDNFQWSLTSIFKYIRISQYELDLDKFGHTTNKAVTCCENCGEVFYKLPSPLEEMKIIQMKTMYQLSQF